MYVYFDASALAKRYAPEDGAVLLNELFNYLPTGKMICPMIGVLEVISVLVRKRNGGRLSSTVLTQAMTVLHEEVIDNNAFSVAFVDDNLILSAASLITQHNINATDAIILRSCLNLQQELSTQEQKLILWSCDKRLLRAAQQEGVPIFNPETGTIKQLHLQLDDV